MWACSLSDHAVHLSNHKLKYWLLIGGIYLVHNFVAACANRQTGLDACSVSIYGNVPLQFLKVPLNLSHFLSFVAKNNNISKKYP